MIIPLYNGKSIIPIYIPMQGNNELTVGDWIFGGLVIVIFIAIIVLCIKFIK